MPNISRIRCKSWLWRHIIGIISTSEWSHIRTKTCVFTIVDRVKRNRLEQDTNSYNHPFRNSLSVLEAFPEWSARIGGAAGRENLLRRIDRLLDNVPTSTGDLPRQEDNMVFQGRVDVSTICDSCFAIETLTASTSDATS